MSKSALNHHQNLIPRRQTALHYWYTYVEVLSNDGVLHHAGTRTIQLLLNVAKQVLLHAYNSELMVRFLVNFFGTLTMCLRPRQQT